MVEEDDCLSERIGAFLNDMSQVGGASLQTIKHTNTLR